MIRGLAALAAFSLALGGCDGGGAPTASTDAQAPKPRVNEYQQKLLALDDRDRKLALRRAIQDDGGSCPRIRSVAYQQEYQRMAMWVARCESRLGTRRWAVYVGATGQVQARDCATAGRAGLPECRAEES